MPGHKNSFNSIPPLKRKLNIVRRSLTNVQPSDSDDGVKALPFQWRQKIRVICQDPDATESSSDDEEKVFPKRLVREILVPVHCASISSDCGVDLDGPHGLGHQLCLLSQPSVAMCCHGELTQHKPVFRKRSSAKKLRTLRKSKGLPQTRKSQQYVGVRRRRQGKWAAEIRDPSEDIRLWHGTYDSAEAAAKAYEMAAKKIGGPKTFTNLGCAELGSCLLEFDNNFAWDQPYQDSASDTSSMRDNDKVLSPACSKFDCIMNSPSSVLDNPVSDDGDSIIVHASENVLPSDDRPIDSGSIEDSSHVGGGSTDSSSFAHVVDSLVVYRPFGKHDDANHDYTQLVPLSLLDGNLFNGNFGRIFDRDIPVMRTVEGLHLLDHMENDSFASGEELHDMDFDLDSEALAWINVSEACGT